MPDPKIRSVVPLEQKLLHTMNCSRSPWSHTVTRSQVVSGKITGGGVCISMRLRTSGGLNFLRGWGSVMKLSDSTSSNLIVYSWYMDSGQRSSLGPGRKRGRQWSITSHRSGWSSSKTLQTINAGEVVEKRKPFCTISGNVMKKEKDYWYSRYKEWYGDSFKKKKTKNKTTTWPTQSQYWAHTLRQP